MKVSTEEFIALIKERPALWQKSHRDFLNRFTRNELMTQVALAVGADAMECSRKLKNLKDAMRAQVNRLPKTSSGLPDFDSSDQLISWAFFKPMLFMKEQFSGPKISQLRRYEWTGVNETINVHENMYNICEPDENSGDQSSSSSVPKTFTGVSQFKNEYESVEYKPNKLKRRHSTSMESDYEDKKPTILENVAAVDEIDTFAKDIANDLRKINCPLKLMQAKSKIRRITEDLVMSEMLPWTPVTVTDISLASSPSHENQA